jgi:molybdopterin-binding protein
MYTQVIGQSWDQLSDKQQEVIRTFYTRLLETYPKYKPLFPQSIAEMEKLMRKVGRTIALLARVSEDTEVLHPHMLKLGDKHRRLNLKKEDLLNFKTVFIDVLREYCDSDCVDMWNRAFDDHVIPYMVQGLESTMAPQQLARIVKMQTSIRNQFLATVVNIKQGAVVSEVEMKMAGGDTMVAMMSQQIVNYLGLAQGSQVYAMIRSPQVSVMHHETLLRVSARNFLCGEVLRVIKGTVNARILIHLKGDDIIQSVVTLESVSELGIKEGEKVCVFFHSKDVILAVERTVD